MPPVALNPPRIGRACAPQLGAVQPAIVTAIGADTRAAIGLGYRLGQAPTCDVRGPLKQTSCRLQYTGRIHRPPPQPSPARLPRAASTAADPALSQHRPARRGGAAERGCHPTRRGSGRGARCRSHLLSGGSGRRSAHLLIRLQMSASGRGSNSDGGQRRRPAAMAAGSRAPGIDWRTVRRRSPRYGHHRRPAPPAPPSPAPPPQRACTLQAPRTGVVGILTNP